MLIPLAVFFSAPGSKEVKYSDAQRRQINRWFWRSAFSRRYSSGVIRNLNTDIGEMRKLKAGEKSTLGDFQVYLEDGFFFSTFGMGNVNTKTFILMLAQNQPLSFSSGAPVDLAKTLKESNRTEFHHLMPKDFLKQSKQTDISDTLLVNMCFMSRADNRYLGGEAPSVYRKKMQGQEKEILAHALCPDSLFKDNYDNFLIDRNELLFAAAETLCETELA
jgi:hypothetical protein